MVVTVTVPPPTTGSVTLGMTAPCRFTPPVAVCVVKLRTVTVPSAHEVMAMPEPLLVAHEPLPLAAGSCAVTPLTTICCPTVVAPCAGALGSFD